MSLNRQLDNLEIKLFHNYRTTNFSVWEKSTVNV